MSMPVMQQILCRGAVDRTFLGALLSTPHQAIAEYELTADERVVLIETPARSLVDLAAAVEAWRRGETVMQPARTLALVG